MNDFFSYRFLSHFGVMKSVSVAALICLVMGTVSCRSTQKATIEPISPIHDTTYITNVQKDSVYVDRWRTEYQKGDTVYVTNNQITSKLITRTDTVYKVVNQPVEVVKEQIKEVEKEFNFIQKFFLFLGLFTFIVGVFWIVGFVRNKIRGN